MNGDFDGEGPDDFDGEGPDDGEDFGGEDFDGEVSDDFDDFDAGEDFDEVGQESLSEENLAGVREFFEQTPEGSSLVQEWGDSLADNFVHGLHAYQHAKALAPEFIASMDVPVERDDGTSYIPGNDPGWMRLAAEFGRLLSHRDFGPSPAEASSANPGNVEIISSRLDDLYELVGTEQYKSAGVQREIQTLERTMGDRPALINGGKYGTR